LEVECKEECKEQVACREVVCKEVLEVVFLEARLRLHQLDLGSLQLEEVSLGRSLRQVEVSLDSLQALRLLSHPSLEGLSLLEVSLDSLQLSLQLEEDFLDRLSPRLLVEDFLVKQPNQHLEVYLVRSLPQQEDFLEAHQMEEHLVVSLDPNPPNPLQEEAFLEHQPNPQEASLEPSLQEQPLEDFSQEEPLPHQLEEDSLEPNQWARLEDSSDSPLLLPFNPNLPQEASSHHQEEVALDFSEHQLNPLEGVSLVNLSNPSLSSLNPKVNQCLTFNKSLMILMDSKDSISLLKPTKKSNS
jgi:hypothetical protein